jgi:hypothetical protein
MTILVKERRLPSDWHVRSISAQCNQLFDENNGALVWSYKSVISRNIFSGLRSIPEIYTEFYIIQI